jgi:hypothetical protein
VDESDVKVRISSSKCRALWIGGEEAEPAKNASKVFLFAVGRCGDAGDRLGAVGLGIGGEMFVLCAERKQLIGMFSIKAKKKKKNSEKRGIEGNRQNTACQHMDLVRGKKIKKQNKNLVRVLSEKCKAYKEQRINIPVGAFCRGTLGCCRRV